LQFVFFVPKFTVLNVSVHLGGGDLGMYVLFTSEDPLTVEEVPLSWITELDPVSLYVESPVTDRLLSNTFAVTGRAKIKIKGSKHFI